jgi:putative ABC transport system permease protein
MKRWLGDAWFRVRALMGRGRMERDMEDEVGFHLEMEERKYRAQGMGPEEARRLARVKFGGEDRFKEQARRSWGVGWLQDLGGDVRFASRQLRRNPAFTALAVLTLALGIGGTVALFSVVDGLMLRPMPVRDESALRVFWMDFDWRGVEFDFVRDRVRAFESLAAYSNDGFTLRTDAGSSIMLATVASSELFDVLGARPLLGRAFRAGEDRPGAEHVIVLSYGLWQESFGGDRDIVGRRIDIDGTPTTVVGVMPRGFYFPTPESRAWIPLDLDPSTDSYQGNGWLVLLGRLKPRVSAPQLQDDLASLAKDLGERFSYPDAWDKTRNPHVTPLREYVLGSVRPALILLLGAVGLVLLMACANVAALILTRTADRTGEMSVRTALGAGRARLARQVLTESVLVGVAAGVVGTGLAAALFDVLVASLPLQGGFAGTLSLHWTTLLTALALAVITGCLVSLAPMRHLLAGDLSAGTLGARRQSGSSAGPGRLQASLVVSEVLLAVVLATGAALLVRTVEHLRAVDPGFDPKGVLTAALLLPEAGTDAAERDQLLASVLERVQSLPGVTAAGFVNRVPARDGGWQATVAIADRPDLADARRPNAFYRPVTPDAFKALGARIVKGRGILPSDREGAPRVAVVNEAFARRIWGNQDPIGRVITSNGFNDARIEVVGVLHDMAVDKLTGERPLAVYYPWAQTMQGSAHGLLVVRTSLDAEGLVAPIRSLANQVDARLTVGRVATMDDVLAEAMAEPLRLRFYLGLFSLLGVVMGTVGVYGVASYGVQRRQGELGIRLALGAHPGRLVAGIVGAGLVPVLIGAAAGLFASWLASSLLARFLFDVAPTDPLSFVAAAGALVLAGVAASLVPALRASGTDPATALRAE